MLADRVGSAQGVGYEPAHLGEGDTRHQIDRQVVEGEDAHIPQSTLGQQHEQGGEHHRNERQRHAEPHSSHPAHDGSDDREDDEQLKRRIVDEEILATEVTAALP